MQGKPTLGERRGRAPQAGGSKMGIMLYMYGNRRRIWMEYLRPL
jgi:hypothetical protein